MQRRENTVEIFSTFIKFELDRFKGWVTEPKLRRSIKTCLQKSPDKKSSSYWALYWHKIWQTKPSANYLAASHLSAYLQESCFWAIGKFTLNVSSHSSLEDYFQIAIAQLPKILKNFNPQYSCYLKSYAELAFNRTIKDLLRVQKEVHICSHWALLHNLSRKRLLKSLQNMGNSRQTIDSYILAWECYRELYDCRSKQTRKIDKPNTDTFKNIAELYNSERLSRLTISTPAIDSQTLENWLLSCAQAARHLLYPKIVSADTPLNNDSNASLLDTIPDGEISLIEREEIASLKNYQTQLNKSLTNAIASLKLEQQKLLRLYYGEQLTQKEIGKKLNLKQYQISRRLSSSKKKLLLSFFQWGEQTLHISPESDVVGAVNSGLEEWLKFHYNPNNEN